jgi:hypothetical protein
MISIGGFQDPSQLVAPSFDPWNNGMQIWDMTDLYWTEAYNSGAAPYQSPILVTEYYNSNSRYPTSWVDPRLQNIFHRPNATTSGSHNSNARAIAGGVVGGMAAFCIIVGLVFCYVKRKQGQRYPHASTARPPPSPPPSHPRFEMLATGKGAPTELDVHINPQELLGQENYRHELDSGTL